METIATLFTNGRSRTVQIPKAYQFTGIEEVVIRKEGDALIRLPVCACGESRGQARPHLHRAPRREAPT